jgi:hypothetical protein
MMLNSIPSPRGTRARLAAATAGAVLALVLLAAPAQAACPYSGAEQVFAPWGDRYHYVLAPDGGFEAGGSGWSLAGGAAVVAGNESYYLNDSADSRSLSLPRGGSAGSPPICMSLDTPLFRLMARNTGDPSSRLRVEAVYRLLGLVRTKVVNDITAGPTWAPTRHMSPVLGLSTIIGTIIPSAIQVRITPLDSRGQWQVDDLYIDPFARH